MPMFSRCREARRSSAHHHRLRAPGTSPLSVAALYTAGGLPAYLMPTLVGRLSSGLGLTATQAGGTGSLLLLASALVGVVLAGRVRRLDPARAARAGLGLVAVGFGVAAAAAAGGGTVPLVLGCLLGGAGAGTANAVAGAGIAAARDPHRASVLGLFANSATAAGLYLLLPRLGDSPALPLAALAACALLALPTVGRPSPAPGLPRGEWDGFRLRPARPGGGTPLPRRSAGAVLAGGLLLWSMAQNALWGVSGPLGRQQAGLDERSLGQVFALALVSGLLGVTAAGLLGRRIGRALPIGLGTVLIAVCAVVTGAAHSVGPFTAGELLWNALYPLVLSHLIGTAAALDRAGRWTVLTGSASSVGIACGPLVGAALATGAGFPAMGAVLGGLLALTAVPVAVVAHRSSVPVEPVQSEEVAVAPVPAAEIWLPSQRRDSPDRRPAVAH